MKNAVEWAARRGERGFTLIEAIVVVFLLAIAMLGILAVFDASARINKSEQQTADAQGNVRYGIYQMTRAIRMAGSGGLPIRQAVLNAPDTDLAGINVGGTYNNVATGSTIDSLTAGAITIRAGTDMIEVRGIIDSPIIGFDLKTGCEPFNPEPSPCKSATKLTTQQIVGSSVTSETSQHVNDDPANRPQFAAVDTYTQGAATNPFLVFVAYNDGGDQHAACPRPLLSYNVGSISVPTTLSSAAHTFGTVDFTAPIALEFDTESPASSGIDQYAAGGGLKNVRLAGILDDFIYFIDDTDHNHPALAWGTRRGAKFDVVTLADDVEDMQIAYGVDTNADNAISDPTAVVNGDEWKPNLPTEVPYTSSQFVDANNCELLHGVMISLVARSKDPDPTYKAPMSQGLVIMDGAAPVAGTGQYRRRVQTLKINLRNYAFPG